MTRLGRGVCVSNLGAGLLIAAFICFVLAAIPPIPHAGSLLAAGLACATLARLVGGA